MFEKELELAKKIAKEAGVRALSFYALKYSVEMKKDESPVTKADMVSHDHIVSELREKSEFQILSEEDEDVSSIINSENTVWVVDPLDGTKDFINKTDEFSVMIGLVHIGQPVLGVVYIPAKDVTYYALRGEGAFREENGINTVIKVSKNQEPSELKMVISRSHFSEEEERIAKEFGIENFRKCGSIGVKLSIIAEGEADFYLNLSPYLGKWDACAPSIILEEAGGVVFDKNGDLLNFTDGKRKMENGLIGLNQIVCKNDLLKFL